jgi:hypothetical protein
MLMPNGQNYTPLNWYWLAKDGRIYSSFKNALVYSYDTGYLAFLAQYGAASPWPTDISGAQTTASLQTTMTQYSIVLPFV